MKKDAVYSMRMSSRVRDALKKAAVRERRTVASLLDKIITDHLAREGFLTGPEFGAERRRFPRRKITLPAKTFVKIESQDKAFPGVLLEISMGGLLVTYPKGSEIRFTSMGELPHLEVCFELPRQDEEICFECETRHMRDTGDEIQVGLAFRDPKGSHLQKLNSYLM